MQRRAEQSRGARALDGAVAFAGASRPWVPLFRLGNDAQIGLRCLPALREFLCRLFVRDRAGNGHVLARGHERQEARASLDQAAQDPSLAGQRPSPRLPAPDPPLNSRGRAQRHAPSRETAGGLLTPARSWAFTVTTRLSGRRRANRGGNPTASAAALLGGPLQPIVGRLHETSTSR